MNLASVAAGVDGVVRTISGVLRHAGTRAGGMVGHDVSTVASNAAAAAGRSDPGLAPSSTEDSRDSSHTVGDQTGDFPAGAAARNVSVSTDTPLHTDADGGVARPQHDVGVLHPPPPGRRPEKPPSHHQAAQSAPLPGTVIPPGDHPAPDGADSDNSSDPGPIADPSHIAASVPADASPQPDPLAGSTPWSPDHHDPGDQQPPNNGMPPMGMPGMPGMGGLGFPKAEERMRRSSPWSTKGKETAFPREKPKP